MDPSRSIWSMFLLFPFSMDVERLQRGRRLRAALADRPRALLAASARLRASRREAGQHSDLQAARSRGQSHRLAVQTDRLRADRAGGGRSFRGRGLPLSAAVGCG